MVFFKKFFDKLTKGFCYWVDMGALVEYMNQELAFSLENNLEASAQFYIYYNNEKHKIVVWNYAASNFKDERAKGLIVYFDDDEYKSIEEMVENAAIGEIKLKDIKESFEIESIYIDIPFLKEYEKNHPRPTNNE